MKNSRKFFLLGLLTLAFGVVVLGNSAVASMAIVSVTGILLLLGGVLQIALGFWVEGTGNKVFTWVLGGLTLFLGWSFLSHPLVGVLSLTTVLLVVMAAVGILQILFAFRLTGTSYFWMLLLSGGVSLVLALVLISSPAATMELIGVLLGLQLLSGGASLVMLGMNEQKSEG